MIIFAALPASTMIALSLLLPLYLIQAASGSEVAAALSSQRATTELLVADERQSSAAAASAPSTASSVSNAFGPVAGENRNLFYRVSDEYMAQWLGDQGTTSRVPVLKDERSERREVFHFLSFSIV
jgi:hypothetical protein